MSVINSTAQSQEVTANPPRGGLAWQRGIRATFRTLSFVECVTWAGLIVGMAFKYLINGNDLGVTIFGWAHGLAFILYLAVLLATAITFRWKFTVLVIGGISSGLPFLTWPFERKMLKSGRLQITV